MRVIETKVFKFDELSEEGQRKAIELFRENLYEYNDFAELSIDDCYLLNPPYREVEKLDSTLNESLLIKNNRKVYFSLDRDRHIDISNAMDIIDQDLFLTWLGVTKRMIREDNIYFTIGKDTIEFEENNYHIDFSDRDLRILERAKDKFENHCEDILNSIEKSIDYQFTDEAIKESIEANEYEFTEEGKLI